MPKTLTVKRKGHTRRAYLREDGTRVKSADVAPSTFKTEDRGKPGRTPKSKRWYEPQVRTGWEKTQPESVRRVNVQMAHGGNELASARAMQALANVTTDRETRRLAREDARYFYRLHRQMPRRRLSKRRSPRITPKQPRIGR